jgi:hypothetical protein
MRRELESFRRAQGAGYGITTAALAEAGGI